MRENQVNKELSDYCNVRLKKTANNSGQDLLHTMVYFIKAYHKFEEKTLKKKDVYSLNFKESYDNAIHTLNVMDRLYSMKYKK